MPLHLSDLIDRLQSGLYDLVPYKSYELILDIAQRDYSHDEQVKIVQELMKGSELLLRKQSRYRLLGVLNAQEAQSLLQHLDLVCPKDQVMQVLERVALNPTEIELEGLFSWFGEERPAPVESKTSKREAPPFAEDVEPTYGLYPYQRRALAEISKRFEKHAPRVMLHMPTGSGKTRTAMAFVCQYLRSHEDGTVVWLADTYELCDQARNEFQRSWGRLGDRTLPLYTITGDVTDVDYRRIQNGFVVITLQTAAAALRREEREQRETITWIAAQRKPLVIFDEAHKAMAPKYRTVLDRLSGMFGGHVLGLSATPGRTTESSEANMGLAHLFNDQKVTLRVEGYPSAIAYLQDMGYLARPIFKSVQSQFDFSVFHGLDRDGDTASITQERLRQIEKMIADDPERTLLVFQEAMRLIQKGHLRILLFAASVEQAHRLAFAFEFFGKTSRSRIPYGARAVSAGEITTEERRAAIDWFLAPTQIDATPKILCNYGILTTGFDAPQTSAVLIARPTNSLVLYSQMVGRGLRGPKSGGTVTCDIVTIVDKNLPAFWDVQAAFSNWEQAWQDENF